jgi:hypothetical protein
MFVEYINHVIRMKRSFDFPIDNTTIRRSMVWQGTPAGVPAQRIRGHCRDLSGNVLNGPWHWTRILDDFLRDNMFDFILVFL